MALSGRRIHTVTIQNPRADKIAHTALCKQKMLRRALNSFDKNVFINCPFDEEYYPLLCPLLFTVLRLGFNPRIALERSDSSSPSLRRWSARIRGIVKSQTLSTSRNSLPLAQDEIEFA